MEQIYILLCLLTAGILYVATSSIAIQCFTQQEPPVVNSNYYFVIVNLVCAILIVLSAIVSMGLTLAGKF